VTVHDIAVKTLSGQDASLGDLAGNTFYRALGYQDSAAYLRKILDQPG
jgi:hypothetical protein